MIRIINSLLLTMLISCGGSDSSPVSTAPAPNPTPPQINFVIASEFDTVGGISNSGSVRIIDGYTGNQVGTTIAGDDPSDFLGKSSVTSLGNGNFVIASENDAVGGMDDAGSVMLIDGTTGAQIGATITGDDANDRLGQSSVTSLGNGNFVIASENDDVAGIVDAGSVMIIDGTTGAQIGATISGDNAGDGLGSSSVTSLGNGNFVIASSRDDVGGVSNAGSVMIINGATGAQIGATIAGDEAEDRLGFSGVISLGNGNFVIASYLDDVGGVVNSGSVMIINGSTGAQIGATISGNRLGESGVILVE